MSDKTDDDNVVYLDRKPGFYKKGPLKFKLYFGTIEELREKGEEAQKPKAVPPDLPDDSPA
ncbi:MAG: hypothetical protein M1455_06355 [Actinobacteria bacterium]|nr:hypothetical protein [Actinomycetota bacterium]